MLRKIRQIHLYSGALFAPLLIILAISGALQTFRLQDKPKEGEVSQYEPPQIFVKLANFHKSQFLEKGQTRSQPLMWFFVLASVGLLLTSGLGIYMAFRFTKNHTYVYLSLALGIILPIVFLLI